MTSVPSRAEILDDIAEILSQQTAGRSRAASARKPDSSPTWGSHRSTPSSSPKHLQKHYGRTLPFHELIAEVGRRTERDLAIGELVAFLDAHL